MSIRLVRFSAFGTISWGEAELKRALLGLHPRTTPTHRPAPTQTAAAAAKIFPRKRFVS